jgi:uncharacterized damage-inducible protein DinB
VRAVTTVLPDEPPQTGGERETLEAMLDFYRAIVVRKLEGLSEADARRTLGRSTMTPIGVVNHLIGVEGWWYLAVLEGKNPDFPWSTEAMIEDNDIDWKPDLSRTVDVVVRDYLDACDRAREAAARHDLDEIVDRGNRRVSLRWIHIHMVEELARHAGHLDLLRESIDGATGD